VPLPSPPITLGIGTKNPPTTVIPNRKTVYLNSAPPPSVLKWLRDREALSFF